MRRLVPPWKGVARLFARGDVLSLQDRNIRNLVIDTAWQGLMMGGVFTFLSVFVVRLGASSLMVSLLTSLPAILMVVLAIPAAQLVQRRRDLVRFTNLVRVYHRGSVLLMALLPFFIRDHLVEAIVIVWTLKTIAVALINSSWTAVVAEVIPPARRARVNGGRWAILSLVTAVAVAVFGVMLDRFTFPLGYQIVFAVSFLGGVVGIIYFGRIVIPDNVVAFPSSPERVSLGVRAGRYARSFGEAPGFLRYVLTTFVLRFGLNLPAALYSIYWIRRLDASDLWIGWQATAGKLALIAGYFLWGRVAARKGHHLVLLACTIGVGLYPMATAVVPTQVWLPLVAVVQGFFVTGIDLSFFDTLLYVCPADKRPSFIAVNSVFMHLAMTLAPMAGSFLADWLGIRTVFFIAGGIHLVSAVLFWVFRIADDSRPRDDCVRA
jgi:MFS family permease